MAIIFTYPTKATPVLADTIVITDSESQDPEDRTKQASIASIKTTMGLVDGTGTANTMTKWSDSNTLTDSPFTIDTSTSSLEMPGYIRHIGDTDSQFGFQGDNHFRVQTGGQTTIQSISRTDELGNTGQVAGLYFNGAQRFFTRGGGVEVEGSIFMPGYIRHLGENDSFFGFSAGDNFILHTDSGVKIAAGPDNVTLYSDTSETATTTSVARLATATTGVLVYGQTIAAGATSERGGIIRYYNNANNRYVGISGPITTGTSYQIRLPDSIGNVGQVLAIASIDGSNAIMGWTDNAGGRTCALTVTSTVTNETIPGANDGAVSIDISGGLANYAVVITHSDGVTTLSNTSSSTPVGFPNLKSGTWTITGDDNEPSGATKCPITGTFSVQAGTCSLDSSVSQITNASDVTVENGSAKATFAGYLSSVNMTLTNSEGKYATQTFSGIDNTFTGLGVGTWVLTGTDSVNLCTSVPVSFTIAANLSITRTSAGESYIPGDVYSMTSTRGSGTGMRITCDETGGEPVIVVAGDGGYQNNDSVEARDNITNPGSPPDVIASYTITKT